MTEKERKEMINLADTIEGEINRMCVTKELTEFDSMCLYARKNIEKLAWLIYKARFKKEKMMDDTIYRQDVIDLFKKYQPYMAIRTVEFGEKLKNLPSAQFEESEVIKCKDCKNWKPQVEVENRGLGTCSFHNAKYVTSEGYCYWAERRTDE